MGLDAGSRLGSFVILAPLGVGGMGEVYRARDEGLDRDVAIKVLPERLTADREALARFEREAKAVAALSHPNILQIHEFGREGEIVYAVTELLDGETLRDRLETGPVAPRKAAELGRQIARGLGAAHEKDIVHRDLKPENLFITKDGRIKILDFGLARTTETSSSATVTRTPTRTELTSPGAVLGTASYMSPEQVRGQPADARSDIFALGIVLYEMMSGERAFTRETYAETMTAILNEEPPETSLSAREVPPTLQRIVQRCMEKRPEERFRSAHDLAFALEGVTRFSTTSGEVLPATRTSVPGSKALRTALASVALLTVGVLAGVGVSAWFGSSAEQSEPVRVRSITFSGKDGAPAASPDGRLIAFASLRDGESRIWLKQLASGSEVALTEGPDTAPRFSRDGSSVLFVRDEGSMTSIYRIPVVGGEPRKLIQDAFEADSSPDGRSIAFLRTGPEGGNSRLGLANADGSDQREILNPEQKRLFGVRWSPDGQEIAVTECLVVMNRGCAILILDPESGATRPLFEPQLNASTAAWSGAGDEIIYAWSDTDMAASNVRPTRVVRQDIDSGLRQTMFWTENLTGNRVCAGRRNGPVLVQPRR
jgi:serine/threonine protein kinase